MGQDLTSKRLCVVTSVTSDKALWSVSPTQGERLVSTCPWPMLGAQGTADTLGRMEGRWASGAREDPIWI